MPRRLWRWAGLLVVVAGGVTAAILLLGDGDDEPRAARRVVVSAPPPELERGVRAASPEAAEARRLASSQPTVYRLTLSGTTYQWNGQSRRYEPSVSFRRPADLVVDPDGQFGIFTGVNGDGTAGQIWVATNSYVYRHLRAASVAVWAARIPAATVTSADGGRTLVATFGGSGSRVVQLNGFAVRPGLVQPRQILTGRIELRFEAGRVSADLDVGGGGYIEPGNNFPVDRYRARLAA